MLTLYIADAERGVGMKNLSQKEAIALLRNLEDSLDSYCGLNEEGKTAFRMAISALNCSEIPNNSDTISRQAAIDKFIDELEEIFSDIREREVDDSVCGLCEYDGAYIGQSGDWCNECPGFDRDDCFKLSDKIRKEWTDEIIKALPSAQPELKELSEWKADFKGYINALNMPKDDYDGIMEYIDEVPSAQPDIIRCRNCKFASGDSRICMQFGHSSIGELDFCAWAERRTDG